MSVILANAHCHSYTWIYIVIFRQIYILTPHLHNYYKVIILPNTFIQLIIKYKSHIHLHITTYHNINTYTYIHTYIYIYLHSLHSYKYVYVHTCIQYIYTYICMYVSIYICTYVTMSSN